MSLIQELGPDYFNDMCRDALFTRNNEVYRVRGVTREGTVQCSVLSGPEAGTTEFVEDEFFTGWKTFSHPVLGYRRVDTYLVSYMSRRQSPRRGLRAEALVCMWSPCSTFMLERFNLPSQSDQRCVAAMKPQFDVLDTSIPELLSGEKCAAVLSENLLIEAAINGTRPSGFNVYFKQYLVGRMDRRGRFTWKDPAMNSLMESFRSASNG